MFPRAVWLSYLALAALIAGNAVVPMLATAPPPPGATTPAPGPPVEFVPSSAIEVASYDQGDAWLTVFVRNDAKEWVTAGFDATLQDVRGRRLEDVTVTGGGKIRPHRVNALKVKISLVSKLDSSWDQRLPARGFLMLTATGGGADGESVRMRDITLLQVQPALYERVVTLIGLVPSALLVIVGLLLKTDPGVVIAVAAPVWTPRSWNSNLAVGGALLSALLAITALPAQTHYMARSSYTVLTAVFAALVLLAPVVYGLLKADGNVSASSAMKMFAFCAAVTLWATLGQLGLTAILFYELMAARLISSTTGRTSAAIVAVVGLLAAIYAFRAVWSYTKPAAAGVPPPDARRLALT
jgi:hypothetical protein